MNCPECEREVYSGSCRCGWRAPLAATHEPKSSNLCKATGCDRLWTINGYCRECYVERRCGNEIPATDEVARDNMEKIRKLLGRVERAVQPPYDKNRRLA